jgi:hypothetical protein
MMFKNDNYALIQIDELQSLQDLFYYLWIFLFLPIFTFLILALPIKIALEKPKKLVWLFFLILTIEFIIYTYLASQTNYSNGILNLLISLFIFILVFYKEISMSSKTRVRN